MTPENYIERNAILLEEIVRLRRALERILEEAYTEDNQDVIAFLAADALYEK